LAKHRKNSKLGECVYCGREALLTDDHIPPSTLYPEVHMVALAEDTKLL
jgi:hypothetical protein